MNSHHINIFSLSYYSLTTQIIIINLITALIVFIIISFFNFFLLNNNKNIQIKTDQIDNQIKDITNYLENNAIFNISQFDEESGEVIFSSKPQLDPYVAQLYLQNQYLDQSNEIKIYNSNLIKYVDIKDLYSSTEIIEFNIDKVNRKLNFYQKYKNAYFNTFNKLQRYFDQQKLKDIIEPVQDDINLVTEVLNKQNRISKIFSYENNLLSISILQPLVQANSKYGAVLVRGFLTQKISESAIISFNLFNLYLVIIFFMFLLSIIFTRSIIRPIKRLSFLTEAEKDNSKFYKDKLDYPIRNDEIGVLSNNIKSMSQALKSQINELENFTADVAHELKNPLSSIKASNELLIEKKIKSRNKKLLFSNIIKDLDRMNRLISDISNYTRTQIEVEKQKFNKFELIEFIEELRLSFQQNKKKINIFFNQSNQKIIVHANINKLAQVFINLIENAISFSPEKSSILIQLTKEKNRAIILLADQGCGIIKKSKDKIFERFYTDRSRANNYHTGLGLSISKKIMESFGGSLELCDNLIDDYKGACFKLELPIKD